MKAMRYLRCGVCSIALSLVGCGGGGGGGDGDTTPTPPIITISPTSKSLLIGESATFTATVTGTDNKLCTWSASGGTVTGQGVYTAPGTEGTYHVTVTSTADTTKSATATVTVSQVTGGVTVSGYVSDAITGNRIGKVRVTATSTKGASGYRDAATRATTDDVGDVGHYEITGVQPGTVTMRFELPDGPYEAVEVTLTVYGSDAKADLSVTLVPRGVRPEIQISPPSNPFYENSAPDRFRYTVTPTDVKPCFSVTSTSPLPVGMIDENGVFTPYAPGTVTVHAYAGPAHASREVTVKPYFCTISGKVTDATSGDPVIGATVSTSDNHWTASDTAGSYVLAHLEPYTYNVTARREDLYDPFSVPVTVSPGEPVTRNFSLKLKPTEPPKGNASGMVIDATTGGPLFAARAAIVNGGSDETNLDGEFLIPGIPAGDQELSVTKEGYAAVTKTIKIEKDAQTNAGTIYLAPLASVPNKPPL